VTKISNFLTDISSFEYLTKISIFVVAIFIWTRLLFSPQIKWIFVRRSKFYLKKNQYFWLISATQTKNGTKTKPKKKSQKKVRKRKVPLAWFIVYWEKRDYFHETIARQSLLHDRAQLTEKIFCRKKKKNGSKLKYPFCQTKNLNISMIGIVEKKCVQNFWSKLTFLANIRNFVKNSKFCQKFEILSKIRNFVKN